MFCNQSSNKYFCRFAIGEQVKTLLIVGLFVDFVRLVVLILMISPHGILKVAKDSLGSNRMYGVIGKIVTCLPLGH